MTEARLYPGDIYCPRCLLDYGLNWSMTSEDWDLICPRCGLINQPYRISGQGEFLWTWSEKYPQPNPGCPYCGSCNISFGDRLLPGARHCDWWCNRSNCRKTWWGFYESYHDGRPMRWTIRLRAKDIPHERI